MEVEEWLVFVYIFDDGVLLGLERDVHFFKFHDLIELVLVEEVVEVVERRVLFHEVLDNCVKHVWFVIVLLDDVMESLGKSFEFVPEN